MQLYEPSRLLFLCGIPFFILLFLWSSAQWNRRLGHLGNSRFLQDRLMPGFSRERRRLGWAFLILVLFLSTLALARPQWGEEKKKIERKGVDVLFLLDASLSMLAEDIKPDRLRKSKLEIKNMIRRFQGHRVGMVAFAGSSFLQSPLTLDYSAFLLFVDALKPGYLPNPGTSLARAIELGIRAFPKENRRYRAMILFSDGEDHEGGMAEALQVAKKESVRIYSLGAGTLEGEPIPLRSSPAEKISGYKKDREGQVVISRLNQTLLEEVAKETGGLYLPVTAGEKELDVILKHLETLGERKLKERLVSEREDHFQLFLFLAFLLLMGETLLGSRRGREVKPVLAFLALLFFTGFIDTPRSLVEKGNRNVEEKKYQSAVENYRKAQVSKPKDSIIRYNLGTALYELYQYRDAEKELEAALLQAKAPETKAKALYNYGNAQYRLGDFEKAIEAYKKALDLNPKDEDAKYNLEFLQKKKALFEKKEEERKQQKPKPQPDQEKREDQQQQTQPKPEPQPSEGEEEGQEKDEGQQELSPQQLGQEGEQREGEGREERPSEEASLKKLEEERQQEIREGGEKDQEQKPAREAKPLQPYQGQMTKENAIRILEALMEAERELQDLRRPPAHPESQEVWKDW